MSKSMQNSKTVQAAKEEAKGLTPVAGSTSEETNALSENGTKLAEGKLQDVETATVEIKTDVYVNDDKNDVKTASDADVKSSSEAASDKKPDASEKAIDAKAKKDASAKKDADDADIDDADIDADDIDDADIEGAEEEDAGDASEDGVTAAGTRKKAKKARKAAVKAVEEPAPVEPDSIFIDHGAILPEFVPGTCLYALVRDPGTLFVYWNATIESPEGWILTAFDGSGNVLQSFRTPARRNGRGYFRIPTARVARVTLAPASPVENHVSFKLESRIRIAQQLGIAQPKPAFDERWVDVANHEVIYEAPAQGRAPVFHEVYQSMTGAAMTGGGYDRSIETVNGTQGTEVSVYYSESSRFGTIRTPGSAAPGSSDIFAASSDRLIRK